MIPEHETEEEEEGSKEEEPSLLIQAATRGSPVVSPGDIRSDLSNRSKKTTSFKASMHQINSTSNPAYHVSNYARKARVSLLERRPNG